MADSLDKDPPFTLHWPFSIAERAQWPAKKLYKNNTVDREKKEESVIMFGDPAKVPGEPLAKEAWFEVCLMTFNEHNPVMKKFGWQGNKRFTTFLDCLEGTARAY